MPGLQLLGPCKGVLSMSSVWISKLGMSLFQKVPVSLSEFQQDINNVSAFRSSPVAVSRPCHLSEFTPHGALLLSSRANAHVKTASPQVWLLIKITPTLLWSFPGNLRMSRLSRIALLGWRSWLHAGPSSLRKCSLSAHWRERWDCQWRHCALFFSFARLWLTDQWWSYSAGKNLVE